IAQAGNAFGCNGDASGGLKWRAFQVDHVASIPMCDLWAGQGKQFDGAAEFKQRAVGMSENGDTTHMLP
ncbi:hypothetical protein, partial [Vibrio diabolicus]|uniref:hypothetical protein n=1 Tax=Vibrio diabolicus TaxID=50719 RepID=UPI00211B077E|nr:hypothetical protein [Vibrio diabolicus]